MKHFFRRLAALVLALTLAAGLAVTVPVCAAGSSVSYSKTKTIYLTSKDGSTYSIETLNISGLTKSQKIKRANVKSSKEKVAAVYSLSRSTSTNTSHYYEDSSNDSSSKSYSYSIGLKAGKAGKTNITYKIGSKTYKTKVTVKAYTNPAKSVKISGVNSGKNIAGKTRNQSTASVTLPKTTKNATFKVKANSGWRIRYIDLYDYETGADYEYYSWDKPVSSATLNVGTLKSSKKYSAAISFVKPSNNATLYLDYTING